MSIAFSTPCSKASDVLALARCAVAVLTMLLKCDVMVIRQEQWWFIGTRAAGLRAHSSAASASKPGLPIQRCHSMGWQAARSESPQSGNRRAASRITPCAALLQGGVIERHAQHIMHGQLLVDGGNTWARCSPSGAHISTPRIRPVALSAYIYRRPGCVGQCARGPGCRS